ncbi:hypothetical protein P3H15_43630 [Rhodococcus sp. T2V]|uniref:hypothetical protein n=1 Tax=Rhodococcus sp. T2V TaxID=3034164 RepID=UPI0023E0B7D7|nr:hypothetical protein [Rhodococcus sp. T2V]MDF3311875.1 hypothetical protein [Rhodococcus sp. T2V]
MNDVDVTRARELLADLRGPLESDGYALIVEADGPGLRISVEAGPDACAGCLVPQPLFANIVTKTLADGGLDFGGVELSYPEMESH